MNGSTEPAGRLPARSESDPAYTWDLESIFESDAAWEARFADVLDGLSTLSSIARRSAIRRTRCHVATRAPTYVDRLEELV